MKILETDSINLSFSGKTILNNIYLSCKSGEIVGLIGRNGSGKSSMMKVIFGTIQADNQSVRINRNYYSHPYRQKARIKYLPQNGFFPDYLTPGQVRRLFRLSENPFLHFEELDGSENKKLRELSGGQKKLLEVLTILYCDADFLLLDEPFSFLAPVTIEKLIPFIRLQTKNKGIILTDHMYRTVLDTCDRLYLVRSGVLHEIHEPNHLIEMGYITELPA